MTIWVDADACPKMIKEVLCKAAIRSGTQLIFVANQPLTVRRHSLIRFIQVGQGFDVADAYIATHVTANDLVITADIPLADRVLSQLALALNPRGELYTQETIKQRLAVRNFMDEVRSSGVATGGPRPLDQRHIQQFSNHLDSYLRKHCG